MRVICTAGHVDHGKSTLVQALTGMHPDRLREEIERQMTIDLGFAWLTLPDGEVVGVVDVPGHEDFIENMLAGVGGLDAALLIVAADEGVMPQTREHVAILELMNIPAAVVAVTKIDAAESDEWIELVELEISELLGKGRLAQAPLVRVSARTGAGLADLLAALADVLHHQPVRRDQGTPLLPIDRVFSMSGFGTVVTGTLSNGTLSVGQSVEFQPARITGRIRGLQSHEQPVEIAQPGSRVAVNVAGVDKSQLQRGDVLSLPGMIQPTLLFDAVLDYLPGAARPLRHNAQVKIFAGTAETIGRVRLLDQDELKPGEQGYVQIQVETPLPLREQQHFVIRIPSPAETVGGGRVLDTAPGRTWKRRQADVLERFAVLASGDEVARLAYQLKKWRVPQPVDHFAPAILVQAQQQYGLLEINGHIAHPDALRQLAKDVERILNAFHAEYPLLVGMEPGELLRRLHLDETAGLVLTALAQMGHIEVGKQVKLPGKGMSFTKAQRRAVDTILAAFDAQPWSPPSYKEAITELGEGVLRALIAQGELVFVRPDVLLRPGQYQALVAYARQQLEVGSPLTVAELRDYFGTSRRIAIPFMDFLEAQGITRRMGDSHILRDPRWDKL